MLKPLKVAVTGSVCCGKSSLCHFLEELGAVAISADGVVHELLTLDVVKQRIVALLGDDVVVAHQLDRGLIAEKVFRNRSLLDRMEALLHPLVKETIDKKYDEVCSQGGVSLFVVEIPLLFETGSDKDYDITVTVIADEEQCRKRYESAANHKDISYDERMSRQLPPDEKALRADYAIANDGDLTELAILARELFRKLRECRY